VCGSFFKTFTYLWGLRLIVSSGVGCGIVLNFGGSFFGLIVFLIYLGGMLVVFGYTTAIATEQYPEVWVSDKVVLGVFVLGEEAIGIAALYSYGTWLVIVTGRSLFIGVVVIMEITR
ncbi:hypothetical protein EI555_012016, partial [Monodon monoceros]